MSAIHTSPLARLPLHVTAGTTALVVNVLATFVGGGTTGDCGVGVYIDGAYNQELVPVANGYTQFTVTLDGAAHDVTLVNSYQNFAVGSFVHSYSATGGTATVRSVATPTVEWQWYSDSIGTGALAVPLTQKSFAALMASVLPEGSVIMQTYGGRSLYADATPANGLGGLGNLDLLVARLQSGFKSPTRRLAIMIGVNDILYSGSGLCSAATYGTNLASLLDKYHAADPPTPIFLFSPIITGLEGTVNSFGSTIGDARTQCSTVASSRTGFVTFTPGTSLMASGGLSGDSLHPTSNGHSSIWDGSGGFAGSTNLRTVFSV